MHVNVGRDTLFPLHGDISEHMQGSEGSHVNSQIKLCRSKVVVYLDKSVIGLH